jgi:pyridoxal phosphate enzyme (YggS family)
VREAIAAGVTELGENRAQELLGKAAQIADIADTSAVHWHFIGRLQRNKVRMLARVVARWHSVDRVELVEPLARHAPGARVLVEVNLSGEPQKGGCRPADTAALADRLRDAGLAVEGLMTVPAAEGDPRPTFAALRELGESLGLPELSMGMTGDFEAAIAEGATIVRIGSALFGPRSGAAGLRR